MSEANKEFLNPSPFATATKHKSVWHYTDAAGLLGILETKSIWASSPKVLNDYNEITYGIDKIRDSLKVLKQANVESKEIISMIEGAISNEFLNEQMKSVFVLSASDNGDLLNQWHHYSQVDGFAIQIDTSVPLGILNNDGTNLFGRFPNNHFFPQWYDAVYLEEDQKSIINQILTSAFQIAKEPKLNETSIFNLVCRIMIMSQMTRLKHKGFQDEREVRYLFGSHENIPVKHRSFSGRMVPYIELVQHHEDGADKSRKLDFIKGIVCGPTISPGDVSLVQEMARSFGLAEIEISRSEIPFRK